MTPPSAILFDLDGTLIHSAPDLHFAANSALEAMGRAPLDLDTIISFIGNGVDKLMERSLRATGECDAALQQRALAEFHNCYAQNMTTLTRPYRGVMETLAACHAAGVPMGVCTNKPAAPAQAICDAMGLSPYFDIVLGAKQDHPKKPDPAPLLACVSALGCDAGDVLYVGDSVVDLQTAQNAMVPFLLFQGGYLNGALPDTHRIDAFTTWTPELFLAR